MTRNGKIILIASSVLVVGLATAILLKRRKDKKDEEAAALLDTHKEEVETAREEVREEVLTDIKNVTIGKFAYANKGGATIRTSAEVDDGWINNRLVKGHAGLIGLSIGSSYDKSGKKWYKIKLAKPILSTYFGQPYTYKIGYVREDVMTLKNK